MFCQVLADSSEFPDQPRACGADGLEVEDSLDPAASQLDGVYGAEFMAAVASDAGAVVHGVTLASRINGAGLYGASVMALEVSLHLPLLL